LGRILLISTKSLLLVGRPPVSTPLVLCWVHSLGCLKELR